MQELPKIFETYILILLKKDCFRNYYLKIKVSFFVKKISLLFHFGYHSWAILSLHKMGVVVKVDMVDIFRSLSRFHSKVVGLLCRQRLMCLR